ncbi:hypothetical protein [Changchengzhania lutea]|uniref:hypothetical protein n=1 Tax=Changchengzhania lutea TaxID=2049305 RepID=UPI00115E745E|nr:hypothetical protein [Changchengzhania lutea]
MKTKILLLFIAIPTLTFSQVQILRNVPPITGSGNSFFAKDLSPVTFNTMKIFGIVRAGGTWRINKSKLDIINEGSIFVYQTSKTYSKEEINDEFKNQNTKIDSLTSRFSKTETEIKQLISKSLQSFDLSESIKSEMIKALDSSLNDLVTRKVDRAIIIKSEVIKSQIINELAEDPTFISSIKKAIEN